MSVLENALRRLDAAVAAAEDALAGGAAAEDGADFAAERARLIERIETLEAQAREDAALRAEAAEAVKAALRDLRAVTEADAQAAGGHPNG